MKQIIKNTIKPITRLFNKMPDELKHNYCKFTNEELEELSLSVRINYQRRPTHLNKELEDCYEKDLNDHLWNRLNDARKRYLPWLKSIKKIRNSSVLEIGCGTGASTLALSEQGADVTAIDIDEGALQVAKDRLRIARQKSEFHLANAIQIKNLFPHKKFDFIIFFASIEHMTIEERIISLSDAWNMLHPSSFLVIVETPNRLWYDDSHTSLLPFFNWLPDELAFMYSKYSGRVDFKDLFRDLNDKNMIHFIRRGRGFSFHELELSVKNVKDLNIVSSLDEFENNDCIKFTKNQFNYIKLLQTFKKGLQKGFCYPYINIIIKKD
ncbi:MAG: class I SAM-dependent methyltransferase [Bacteroidetes bacterium]|nr:class I SAM-dependent methyltransferase [Bacteroidota bacterium]